MFKKAGIDTSWAPTEGVPVGAGPAGHSGA
jgi:hypothetical protein